jgi:hypothetical protein
VGGESPVLDDKSRVRSASDLHGTKGRKNKGGTFLMEPYEFTAHSETKSTLVGRISYGCTTCERQDDGVTADNLIATSNYLMMQGYCMRLRWVTVNELPRDAGRQRPTSTARGTEGSSEQLPLTIHNGNECFSPTLRAEYGSNLPRLTWPNGKN